MTETRVFLLDYSPDLLYWKVVEGHEEDLIAATVLTPDFYDNSMQILKYLAAEDEVVIEYPVGYDEETGEIVETASSPVVDMEKVTTEEGDTVLLKLLVTPGILKLLGETNGQYVDNDDDFDEDDFDDL